METELAAGDLLADKYRVVRLLGRGGMGVVLAAEHVELLEMRAIKLMISEIAMDRRIADRFLHEARASARLKSEHIAKVYDFGRLRDGAPYMVMEYLEGADLATVLEETGPVAIHEAVLYALQTCEALVDAHAAGLVHRDIKPSNLFLTRRNDGSPCIKILDFGVAKHVESEMSCTASSVSLGTPLYMPPEQMASARDVDGRADLWAVGVVLYKLLTGEQPFSADSKYALYQLMMTADPRPPSALRPAISPALDAIVIRCLQRDREMRPMSAWELCESLRLVLADVSEPRSAVRRRGSLVPAPPVSVPPTSDPKPRVASPATPTLPASGTILPPWQRLRTWNDHVVVLASIAAAFVVITLLAALLVSRSGPPDVESAEAAAGAETLEAEPSEPTDALTARSPAPPKR